MTNEGRTEAIQGIIDATRKLAYNDAFEKAALIADPERNHRNPGTQARLRMKIAAKIRACITG